MSEMFSRLLPLFTQESLDILASSKVAVFGLGGVGGFAAEALVRSGIGHITIIDADEFDKSNLNRQIFSLYSTLGQRKTEVAAKRLLDINPDLQIKIIDCFITPDNIDEIELCHLDFVIDAIDTVTTKLILIERCVDLDIKIVSCMGTGKKVDLTKLKLTKIEKTSGCPLARVMRRELKTRGIHGIDVVYSDETGEQKNESSLLDQKNGTRPAPSSCIFVPATAGLMLASHVVMSITNINNKERNRL